MRPVKRAQVELRKAVERGVPQKHINRHIAVRSSQLILLFLAIEAFILFDIRPFRK